MTITESLNKILSGDSLTREEALASMDQIMTGQCTAAQIGGWLIALRQKGEAADEVAGFVESMRRHSLSIEIENSNAVDGCGTGGDGSHSFNISTAAALVAAAAGATVAKHGNRSVSSKCGSADLLQSAGGMIDPGVDVVKKCIDTIGFGFMFAPRFHPAMKHAIGPRRELGVRTVFNILGPMTNPAAVKRQVIGVYDPALMKLMGDVLLMTGTKHAFIVHALDGLDEFSVCSPSEYLECRDGKTERRTIEASDVGLKSYPTDALAGGDPKENLAIMHKIFGGEEGACCDATTFNAGAILYVSGKADSIADGVKLAKKAIEDGLAREKLAAWVTASKG